MTSRERERPLKAKQEAEKKRRDSQPPLKQLRTPNLDCYDQRSDSEVHIVVNEEKCESREYELHKYPQKGFDDEDKEDGEQKEEGSKPRSGNGADPDK